MKESLKGRNLEEGLRLRWASFIRKTLVFCFNFGKMIDLFMTCLQQAKSASRAQSSKKGEPQDKTTQLINFDLENT